MYKPTLFNFLYNPTSRAPAIHSLHNALQQFSVFFAVKPQVFVPLLLTAAQNYHDNILLAKPAAEHTRQLLLTRASFQFSSSYKPRSSKQCFLHLTVTDEAGASDFHTAIYGQQLLHTYCDMLQKQASPIFNDHPTVVVSVPHITQRFLPPAGHVFLPQFMEDLNNREKYALHKDSKDTSDIPWDNAAKQSFKL